MLAEFKNDFFASHNDMGSALRYVNDLCGTADGTNSIAIRTAAHIILNTAIEMHRAEKQVLVDKINEMSTRANPVTALLTLVREQVREAIAEQDVGELIDNWMRDNLDQKIEDWNHENVDIENAVEEYMSKQSIMDDLISEKIGSFFGNNTFTIEPR